MTEPRSFLDGRVVLHPGDCREVLKTIPDCSIDSICCDPPYHLQSITKRFAKVGRTDKTWSRSGPHQRTATGFMNKKWDGGDIAFQPELWAEVLSETSAHCDSGSAARFFATFPQEGVQRIFYTSKADSDDRLGSRHPTVKPLDLIQYLVRLITPRGGTCLDLFAGTGTTGEACFREGFRAILIELEAEYIADIERRMSLVMEGPATRAHAGMKARGRLRDDGPLFGGITPQEKPRVAYGEFARHWGAEDEARRPPLDLVDLKIKLADIALAAGRDIEVRLTLPDDEAAE